MELLMFIPGRIGFIVGPMFIIGLFIAMNVVGCMVAELIEVGVMAEIKNIIKSFARLVKREFELMIFKYNISMCQFYKKQMYTHSDICKRIVEKWEKQW